MLPNQESWDWSATTLLELIAIESILSSAHKKKTEAERIDEILTVLNVFLSKVLKNLNRNQLQIALNLEMNGQFVLKLIRKNISERLSSWV